MVTKGRVQPFWTKMKIGQSRILQLSCSSNSHKKKTEKLYPTSPLSAKLVIDHPNCVPNDSGLTESKSDRDYTICRDIRNSILTFGEIPLSATWTVSIVILNLVKYVHWIYNTSVWIKYQKRQIYPGDKTIKVPLALDNPRDMSSNVKKEID